MMRWWWRWRPQRLYHTLPEMAARAAAGKAGDSQGAYGLLSPRGVSKIWSPPEPSREGVAGEETIPVEGEHGVREGDDQAPDNGEENGDKLVMSRASAVVHADAAGQSCRHGDLSQFHWSKKKNAVATRKSHSDSRGSCVRPPGDDCMFHKSRKAAVVGSLYRLGRMVDTAAK